MAFTIETLLQARTKIEAIIGTSRADRRASDLMGLQIVSDMNVLKETTERLFPESPHRSARIRKKLIKRHGGEFRKAPAIWLLGDRIIMHPDMYARFEDEMARRDAIAVMA